jgi:putative membrane protein
MEATMRNALTLTAVCALCALACSRQSDRNTTTPAANQQATASQQETDFDGRENTDRGPAAEDTMGPAPGPREMTGQSMDEKKADATGDTDEVQPVAGKTGMTDANILAALIASNEHEVKVGEIVAGKTKRADVKRYAKMLMKDHGGALKKIDALESKMGVDAMDDENVRMMRDQSSQKMSKLNGLTGKELDDAFLQMAVDDHRMTLERIDGKLLPAAQNEDLRALMTGMRPTVQHHLDDAQKLLDKGAR